MALLLRQGGRPSSLSVAWGENPLLLRWQGMLNLPCDGCGVVGPCADGERGGQPHGGLRRMAGQEHLQRV